MVSCNWYRSPALFAKMASTVDVLSNGRLYAGLGAGWYEHEWKAYGYEWPETKDRMGAFREATEIISRMWTEDEVVFSGKYYSVDKPINEPKGVRKPHPSLWIGGGGPKVTLKLVAKYADACNVGGGDPDTIREKLAILREHCDTVGRDYDTIIKSTDIFVFPIDKGDDPKSATEQARGRFLDWERFERQYAIGTEDELTAKVEAAIEAGADYVNFYVPGVAYDLDLVARMEVAKPFASPLPALKGSTTRRVWTCQTMSRPALLSKAARAGAARAPGRLETEEASSKRLTSVNGRRHEAGGRCSVASPVARRGGVGQARQSVGVSQPPRPPSPSRPSTRAV